MCGRYVTGRAVEEYTESFEADMTDGDGPGLPAGRAGPDYNVAPTTTAPVVLERRRPPDQEVVVRWMRLFSWGLVPSWWRDRSRASRMINARAESLLERPSFAPAARSRRCLVPADGWYEWQSVPGRSGRGGGRPFYFTPDSGEVIAFAGVYELWRIPGRQPREPSSWWASFAIVTTAAEPGLRRIHDRMPLVLPRDRWGEWLDPRIGDPRIVRSLLSPPSPGAFTAVPVPTAVNTVTNNGPGLIEPLPPR
jgi:putative SOS response-associated peptidase YedK